MDKPLSRHHCQKKIVQLAATTAASLAGKLIYMQPPKKSG